MFKSIEYKLIFYLCLLLLSVGGLSVCLIRGLYASSIALFLFSAVFIIELFRHYKRYNDNILFLFNALDNGEYSFNFRESCLSKRERELNCMMNRIKEIIIKARNEAIENEKFLSEMVETLSTGIFITDISGSVIIENEATRAILGLTVFTHLNQLGLIRPDYPRLFREAAAGDSFQISLSNEKEEKSIRVVLSEGILSKRGKMRIYTLSNIGNELESKELESWIKLIRVMTHEIMNSIAPITSLTDTLLFMYGSSEENPDILKEKTLDALNTINRTAKGLSGFVESYRKFTGVPKPILTPISLNRLVKESAGLELSRPEAKNIKFFLYSNNKEFFVNADENQISQVLVNLLKNAVEAIGFYNKGEITASIVQEEGRIILNLSNDGAPIPEEIAPNIFIPFFTTKESGSGIGLSISRYIMRLHGGNLKLHASYGKTVFSMEFQA